MKSLLDDILKTISLKVNNSQMWPYFTTLVELKSKKIKIKSIAFLFSYPRLTFNSMLYSLTNTKLKYCCYYYL